MPYASKPSGSGEFKKVIVNLLHAKKEKYGQPRPSKVITKPAKKKIGY